MNEDTNIEDLKTAAEAALELEKRKRDSRLLFYRPCCKSHSKWEGKKLVVTCPTLICPDSKHVKFHLSDRKQRIVLGGNRSGKTSLGIIELLLMACFKVHPFRKTPNPNKGKYRIYGSDFGVIEKIHLPFIKEWIPMESLQPGKNKEEAWENSYDTKFHILTLRSSTIDFMSYDQPASKSASVELDGIAADEEMPEDVYSEAMARIVSKDGKFWMTVTPLYCMSWAMRFLDEVDPQTELFNFEIWDNPHLPEKAVKEFEQAVPEHEKEARLYGRFLELGGLVYKELRKDVHLVKPDSIPSNYPIVFSLDPHPRKPSVMAWAYITPKDDIVFFDELEMGGTARDIARAIFEKESKHSGRTLLRLIDPAAKKQGNNFNFETDTVREFEKEGLGFTLADNSDAGYNIVHEYLSYDKSLPLSSTNRPRCFFTYEVPILWKSMTHLMWSEWAFRQAMKDKRETIRDYQKDGADTVRYVVSYRPNFRSFISERGSIPLGNVSQMQPRNDVRAMLGARLQIAGR